MRTLIAILGLLWLFQPAAPTNVHVVAGLVSSATACSDAATAGTARYLRAAASGSNNGSNWNNAWTTLSAAHTGVTRGQTVCVAGGTYTSQTLNKATSGTSTISFVRALTTDHGTSAGWLDAFATQATFTDRMTFGTDYWVFNGQVGDYTTGGIGSYGFRFNYSEGGAGALLDPGSNITLKYIDCDGVTVTGEYTYGSQAKCIEAYGGSNWLVSHVAMHGCESCLQGGGTSGTLEYSYIYNSRSNAAAFHNNVFYISGTNGLTIRYNHVWDYSAEGFFLTGFNGANSNIKIYGNTMQDFGGEGNFPRAIELRQDYSYTNVEIYNNTFVNLGDGIVNRAPETGNVCTGCVVRNNISVNSPNTLTGTTNNNNTDDSTTSRFVNLGTRTGTQDLHITAGIAGAALATEFNTDPRGNTRGADGTWDRGAYEFCTGGCTFTARTLARTWWAALWSRSGPVS